MPVAKNLVYDARSILSKHFSATEGQVIDIAENEAMTHVEVGIAVVLVGVALVLEISIVHRSQAGTGGVVEGVREGISRFVLEAVRVALLQANLQRVVIRLGIRAEGGDTSVKRDIAVVRR